jgi:hypothetical protein
MKEIPGEELVRAVHQAALLGAVMIDQVPDVPDSEPLAREWKTFKREVGRLVAEGHAGRFAIVKGDQVVSVWDTPRDAEQGGRERFGQESFLVQEVQLFLRPLQGNCAGTPRKGTSSLLRRFVGRL